MTDLKMPTPKEYEEQFHPTDHAIKREQLEQDLAQARESYIDSLQSARHLRYPDALRRLFIGMEKQLVANFGEHQFLFSRSVLHRADEV